MAQRPGHLWARILWADHTVLWSLVQLQAIGNRHSQQPLDEQPSGCWEPGASVAAWALLPIAFLTPQLSVHGTHLPSQHSLGGKKEVCCHYWRVLECQPCKSDWQILLKFERFNLERVFHKETSFFEYTFGSVGLAMLLCLGVTAILGLNFRVLCMHILFQSVLTTRKSVCVSVFILFCRILVGTGHIYLLFSVKHVAQWQGLITASWWCNTGTWLCFLMMAVIICLIIAPPLTMWWKPHPKQALQIQIPPRARQIM